MTEEHSVEELQHNLQDYREQLEQVGTLLLSDPHNDELREMYDSLTEVIHLTEDLLRDAGVTAALQPSSTADLLASAAPAPPAAAASAALQAAPAISSQQEQPQLITTPAELNVAAILPASVAEQIRKAQIKQALLGQGNAAWAIGADCLALYTADGQYYPAKVKAVTEDGKFVVVYEGYGNEEVLPVTSVRPPAEETNAVGYTGVAAPKRKRVEDEPLVDEAPPKWLEIKPTDDEKTIARKKKLLKSFKSKKRFQEMDVKQKERQNNWQSFMKGKGSKAKAGFFTGRKKESIFKVPEGGKVGVIGSGKGLTEYKKQTRHEFNVE